MQEETERRSQAAVVRWVAGAILVVLVVWLGFPREAAPANDGQSAAATVIRSESASPLGDDPDLNILQGTSFMKEFGAPETTAQRELELVQLAFRDYLDFVKPPYRRPFGNSQEFVEILAGGNRPKIASIPPRHERIDSEGNLTDKWGSRLDIHPLSSTCIEVRSAGPDRKMWTGDDLQSVTLSGEEIVEKMSRNTARTKPTK